MYYEKKSKPPKPWHLPIPGIAAFPELINNEAEITWKLLYGNTRNFTIELI